jgi:F0F1-type ATP synthase membrane subunit b/b'
VTAAAETEELRALVREAHAAIKDMDRLLADYRRTHREAAQEARASAQQAAAAELDRFARHLQHEANAMAAELNRSVLAARAQIARQLAVAEVGEHPDGRLYVKFGGNLFDTDPHGDNEEGPDDG